ncbi:MAG: hypothetical protein KDD69_17740 [Bdellovibrionales bacterium]|nr:hypothetical protein [Bdellovibrionales bacterium]
MAESCLQLWFSKEPDIELYKTTFAHHLNEGELAAVRGKSTGLPGTVGSFQWTPAVQALSIVLLKTAAWGRETQLEGEDATPRLEGTAPSPASSLGYAISKQSDWLLDIFGLDRKGSTIAKRILRTHNAAQRLKGPAVISVNTNQLSPDNIKVYVDELQVCDPKVLLNLAYFIERLWRPQRFITPRGKRRKEPAPAVSPQTSGPDSSVLEKSILAQVLQGAVPSLVPVRDDTRARLRKFVARQKTSSLLPPSLGGLAIREDLREMFKREVFAMLSITDIFRRNQLARALSQIYENPLLIKLGARNFRFDDEACSNLTYTQQLGTGIGETELQRNLCRDEPLRIMVPTCAASSVSILYYLKYFKGYNIEVDYRFALSKEILAHSGNGISGTHPDACITVIATAVPESEIRKKAYGEFLPVLLMPQTSMRVVAPLAKRRRSEALGTGQYGFLAEESWCSPLYFEDLVARGTVNPSKVKVVNMPPDEASALLAEGDPSLKSIIWFPNHNFNVLFNRCEYLSTPRDDINYQGLCTLGV